MASNSRFFIMRSDGTTTTVDGDKLSQMRHSGQIRPDDRVIPVAVGNEPTPSGPPIGPTFSHAVDDLDTAPLELATGGQSLGDFSGLGELEIDQALNSLVSENLYQLQAQTKETPSLLEQRTREPFFNIRFASGQIVGEFSKDTISDRIHQGKFRGDEEVSEIGTDHFKPLRDYAVFCQSLKIYVDAQNPPEIRHRLGPMGISPVFFELAQELKTGWLTVTSKERTFVLSIAVGRPRDIFSGHPTIRPDEDLRELFALEQGDYWFQSDPVAAGTENRISADALHLCREHTGEKNAFSLRRLIQFVGDQHRLIQKNNASPLVFHDKDLQEDESLVWSAVQEPVAIADLVKHLTGQNLSEDRSLYALFLLNAAGFVSFVAPVQEWHPPKIEFSAPAPAKPQRRSWAHAVWAVSLAAFITGILWMFAVDLSFGETENSGQSLDPFLAIRWAVLFLGSLIGFALVHRQGPKAFFKRTMTRISWPTAVVITATGAAIGALTEQKNILFQNMKPFAFLLVLTTVFFERMFFSGFVMHELLETSKKRLFAVAGGSIVYFAYLLSYSDLIISSVDNFLIRGGLIFATLCFPLAIFQATSKSSLAPLLYQTVFLVVAHMVVYFGQAGWFFRLWGSY